MENKEWGINRSSQVALVVKNPLAEHDWSDWVHTHTETQGISEAGSEIGVQIFTQGPQMPPSAIGLNVVYFFAWTFLSL